MGFIEAKMNRFGDNSGIKARFGENLLKNEDILNSTVSSLFEAVSSTTNISLNDGGDDEFSR